MHAKGCVWNRERCLKLDGVLDSFQNWCTWILGYFGSGSLGFTIIWTQLGNMRINVLIVSLV